MEDGIFTDEKIKELEEGSKLCSAWALSMVERAGSGHPGGSLSSMKLYMAVYSAADITPKNCTQTDRDYVVISHGHTSPAAYGVLAYKGFVDPLDAIKGFRSCGCAFQGHVERSVPGIDWGSGNLGQGLSAGVGFALALKKRGLDRLVYVLMGDGEQPKGQIGEARRIAVSQGLNNITVLIDLNHIQISGKTEEVMAVNVKSLWEADGWEVLEADGNDFKSLFGAMEKARLSELPSVILCDTIMGQGVSFMEGKPDYHGKALGKDLYLQAIKELGQENWLEKAENHHSEIYKGREIGLPLVNLELGVPITYKADKKTDNRSAFGNALADVGALNIGIAKKTPILVFDCDLSSSVKTDLFAKNHPYRFIQCGIQEHSTATTAGAASCCGVVSVWADFGVFGLGEVYNQQRLNDINKTNLKLVLTHVGLDVGEDGMTHQCIDYVSLLSNTFGWKLVVPVDPNQTDRAVRWALTEPGNICIAMGRSAMYPMDLGDGPFFSKNPFVYGKSHLLKDGKDGAILALGSMAYRALEASKNLSKHGLSFKVYAVSSPLSIDMEALKDAVSTGFVLTLEDHNVKTGMGAIWSSAALKEGLQAKWSFMGVRRYGFSGPGEEVYRAMGLSVQDIESRARELKGL